MTPLSRRDFVRMGAAGAVAAPFVIDPLPAAAADVTAQQIVDRIRASLGVEWKTTTVDTFKAGDPATRVTGVVTTSLATIDVLRRAVKAGANMVITSGPTFYSSADRPAPPAGRGGTAAPPPSPDPVFTAKNGFIAANNLVVWRFSDHWRLRTPDPFAEGLAEALGWSRHQVDGDPRRLMLPAVTLEALLADVKKKLGVRGGMRIVGNPKARVRRVALAPGTIPIQTTLRLLPTVDTLIAGEIREWESSEYARDTVTAGLDKGLILIGRTLSEERGMSVCARWLQTIVPDVPCRWLPAGDPYWSPA